MLKITISETSVHVQRHEGGMAAMHTAIWNLNKAGPCTQSHIPVTLKVNTAFLHSFVPAAGTEIPTVSQTSWRGLLGWMYLLDAPTSSSFAEQAGLPSLSKYSLPSKNQVQVTGRICSFKALRTRHLSRLS